VISQTLERLDASIEEPDGDCGPDYQRGLYA
jgi:hypothetical protein